MKDGLSIAGLVLSGTLYAVILEAVQQRWQLVARRTWITVVIGNALILAWLLVLLPFRQWLKVAAAFAAAGSPVVARSILHEILREMVAERRIR